MPALGPPPKLQRPTHTGIATWNINRFWSKKHQIVNFLYKEQVVVVSIQETLVRDTAYPVTIHGYQVYQRSAKEGFRGTALLVDRHYSLYEVPHGLRWLTHVKIFRYVGVSGPTHLIGVYLASGGNHRTTRREAFCTLTGVVSGILNRNPLDRVVVMGDLNCAREAVNKSLQVVNCDSLLLHHIRGSPWSCFPVNGRPRALDQFLLTENAYFLGGRVLRAYNSSDHRPVVIRPRAQLPDQTEEAPWVKFDNKMICVKGDLVVNDNAWTQLMTWSFGEDYLHTEDPVGDQETKAVVLANATGFINTFDTVCQWHLVKKEVQPMSRQMFPRKLKQLLKIVK
jgi:endonuclease/exonuclease/phosphatase family metal-dependent hydrolase